MKGLIATDRADPDWTGRMRQLIATDRYDLDLDAADEATHRHRPENARSSTRWSSGRQ